MKDDERIPEITSGGLRREVSRRKWNTSWRHQRLQRRDERNDETNLQRGHERNNFTPEEWKKVKIKVIYKKGDVEDVSNYRPICSLPSMYKLFSTVMYGRLYPMLDEYQAEDQAGFRKTYQTTDHLATYRCWNKNVRSGESKCGQRRWTSWRRSTPSPTTLFGRHPYLAMLIMDTSASWKKLQRSEGISANRRREWNFRYPKRLQTGRSAVQPAVQHGAAVCIKKLDPEMAKKIVNGYLLERPRTRLPDELAIRWRRDVVRNIQRTDSKHDVWSQRSNRKWDSRFTQTRRKFSAMKAAWILTQKDT